MAIAPAAHPRARRRDTEALAERLYAENRQRLLTIARRNCDSAEDAEEALHDALLVFIERFDPADGSPALPWLMLTLKRRCWAIYGRGRELDEAIERAREERACPHEAHSVEELAEIGELVVRLRAAMGTLQPAERQALALLAVGFSYREIAERMDCAPKRVDHLLQRARAKLRLAADGTEGEPGADHSPGG